MPRKIKAALEKGYVTYGNDSGTATFGHVSVKDCVSAIILVLHGLQLSKLDVSTNPYIVCVNKQENTWGEVARRLAEELY